MLGGGLVIAKGFIETGFDAGIAQQLLFLKDMPSVVIILAVVTLTLFLTEITSNTATTTNDKGWIMDEFILHSDYNIICDIETSVI